MLVNDLIVISSREAKVNLKCVCRSYPLLGHLRRDALRLPHADIHLHNSIKSTFLHILNWSLFRRRLMCTALRRQPMEIRIVLIFSHDEPI